MNSISKISSAYTKKRETGGLNKELVSVGTFYFVTFLYCLTGIEILSLFVFFAFLYNALNGRGYLMLPILVVLSNYLLMPFGLGGMYKYALIFLLIWELFSYKNFKFSRTRVIQIVIIFIYMLLVLIPNRGFSIVTHMVVLIYYYIMWTRLHEDSDKLKNFCMFFASAMLISLALGVYHNNFFAEVSTVGQEQMDLVRFFATFVDPNYAGMFFNAAIIMCVIIKSFSFKIRLVVLLGLYVGMLMTTSATAILCNVLFWLIMLIVRYGFNAKTFMCILGVCVLMVGLYFVGLNSDIELLNMAFTRVQLKINSVSDTGSLNTLTSGRMDLSNMHFDYLMNDATISNWLVGGLGLTALYCDPALGGMLSHLEYLDLLLNVGVLGATLYIGCILYRFFRRIKQYKRFKRKSDFLVIMLWVNYLLYGFSITMFWEPKFFIWIMM